MVQEPAHRLLHIVEMNGTIFVSKMLLELVQLSYEQQSTTSSHWSAQLLVSQQPSAAHQVRHANL